MKGLWVLIAVFVSLSAGGATTFVPEATVDRLEFQPTHGGLLVRPADTSASSGLCTQNDFYLLEQTHPFYSELYPLLLGALTTGRQVGFHVENTCPDGFPAIVHVTSDTLPEPPPPPPPPPPPGAQSVTKFPAGSGSQGRSGSSSDIENSGNIKAADDAYTSNKTDLGAGQYSKYARAKKFQLNIPATATIVGIEVFVEAHNPGPGGVVIDELRLIDRDKNPVGDNKATGQAWGDQDEIKTYGGPTDTWGVAWTPADINHDEVGVGVSIGGADDGASFLYVDDVYMTVYYTEPGS